MFSLLQRVKNKNLKLTIDRYAFKPRGRKCLIIKDPLFLAMAVWYWLTYYFSNIKSQCN